MQRTRLLVPALVLAVASAALAAPTMAAPRRAAVVAGDACGDSAGPAEQDLSGAAFEFSRDSFQVRTSSCAKLDPTRQTDSFGWAIAIHLTDLDPPVVIEAEMVRDPDVGIPAWDGYTVRAGDGPERRLSSYGYFFNPVLPTLSGRSSAGYGNWADHPGTRGLADGRSALHWYAELHKGSQVLDRVPDSGQLTSRVVASPAATTLRTSGVGPATVRAYQRAPVVAEGDLRTGTGPLPFRQVFLQFAKDGAFGPGQTLGTDGTAGIAAHWGSSTYEPDGRWNHNVVPSKNVTLRPYYTGDGFTATGAGTPFRVLVRKWVTFNLPARKTITAGTRLRFDGVVRPRELNSTVTIQVRRGGPGAPWKAAKTVPVVVTPSSDPETVYEWFWRPVVRGVYDFRVVWYQGAGATADGNNLTGISNVSTITVR